MLIYVFAKWHSFCLTFSRHIQVFFTIMLIVHPRLLFTLFLYLHTREFVKKCGNTEIITEMSEKEACDRLQNYQSIELHFITQFETKCNV